MSLCENCNKTDCSFGFQAPCKTCGQFGCTWGKFSFENMEHQLNFDCDGFRCTFGDFVSQFDEDLEENVSWWPTPFPSSPKPTIPLAEFLKNFCKCFLELVDMKVNRDHCLLHGIHSDADEEEEIDSDDDGYYCW